MSASASESASVEEASAVPSVPATAPDLVETKPEDDEKKLEGKGVELGATSLWAAQEALWPRAGKHIMAQFNDTHVVVYQAFNPQIADWAVEHQTFGGPAWSGTRMTWIKTSWLWMMYRAGWCNKDANQKRVLAITLTRSAFERILCAAWPSSYTDVAEQRFGSKEVWQEAKAASEVVLQWDPDHAPDGTKQERRAVQLGLRPVTVQNVYNVAGNIARIQDVTPFVEEQAKLVAAGQLEQLLTPVEEVYQASEEAMRAVGIIK